MSNNNQTINKKKDKLIIFDTTLRDGEQSPGASMTLDEKVRIAKTLEKMQVDVIEAGFAIASKGDFASVQAVANTIKDSTICSLARALDRDIDTAGEALKGANSSRIHTFIATSPIHMQHKLNMSKDEVVEAAVKAVKRASKWTDNIEFSPEDAGRSEIDFLCRVIEEAIKAGATTINIPDTVGYNLPNQFGETIRMLIERIPNSDKAIFSTHCHNDLGLAVANSLSGVMNGARQVECTINGLGERAGNTSLEEIVMAVRTRADAFDCETGIDATHIVSASKLVSSITGFVVQPNKAIVGKNAFAHEAGIHQDGILKNRDTYEIMRAEDVGWGANALVLGKHSGRNAVKSRMQDLGIDFASDDELKEAFARFKQLADQKHEIFDEDLQAIISDMRGGSVEIDNSIKFISVAVSSKTDEENEATIELEINGEKQSATAKTHGAVDSCFSAINKLVKVDCNLQLYSVSNVTEGTDAQGEVSVRLEFDGKIVSGKGVHTDIIKASVKAYLDGLNKILSYQQKAHPQI
jgi:2-isopropylmalate synthase